MAIRIGEVELKGVQQVYADETRYLVEHQVPGAQGNTSQDLGREPVKIIIRALLYGAQAESGLETLRSAYLNAEPLEFTADIATGTPITQVVIEYFQARQAAGYTGRYQADLRLREYIEPPAPAGVALAQVDTAIGQDAASWSEGALGAVSALQAPAGLPGLLAQAPQLLQSLDMNDLAGSLAKMAEQVGGGEFGDILATIAQIDPEAVMELVNSLKEADSLGDFLDKLATEGVDLLEKLTGVDLGMAASLIQAVAGGADFLMKLKQVISTAEALVDDLAGLETLGQLKKAVEALNG